MRRMTSETVIFDTDWITEADFETDIYIIGSIDYQTYDTLKIIVDVEGVVLNEGGLFQELDVYKIENRGLDYIMLLSEQYDNFLIEMIDSGIAFYLTKSYWENNLKGIGSVYIKGVKR